MSWFSWESIRRSWRRDWSWFMVRVRARCSSCLGLLQDSDKVLLANSKWERTSPHSHSRRVLLSWVQSHLSIRTQMRRRAWPKVYHTSVHPPIGTTGRNKLTSPFHSSYSWYRRVKSSWLTVRCGRFKGRHSGCRRSYLSCRLNCMKWRGM